MATTAHSFVTIISITNEKEPMIIRDIYKSKVFTWARHKSIVVKLLTLNAPGSHIGTSFNPSSPTFHPAPCLWPGTAAEDTPKLWVPTPI